MRRLVIVLTAAALGAAIGWAWGPSAYRSVGVIEVVPESIPFVSFLSDSPGEPPWRWRSIESRIALYRSRRFAERARQALTLQSAPEGAAALGTDEFADRLSVTPHGPARFIRVAFVHPDPEVASAAANAACFAVVRHGEEEAEGGRSKILAKLSAIRSDLDACIAEATEGKGSAWLEAEVAARNDSLSRLQTRLDGLDAEIAARGEFVNTATVRRRVALADQLVQRGDEVAGLAGRAERVAEWNHALQLVSARREELQLEIDHDRLREKTVRLVSPPMTPDGPFTPDRPKQALLGGILGLVAGLGLFTVMRS